MVKEDIRSLTKVQLEAWLTERGYPRFRSKQLFHWLHKQRAESFEEMKNLPKVLLAELKNCFYLPTEAVLQHAHSQIDETEKFLIEFYDKETAECVLMKYKHGYSLCVSTQVGCKMGCKFCASTLAGFVRNLSAGEILGQVYLVEKEAGISVSNLVLMGIGEPFDNFTEVDKFLSLITDEAGKNLGKRHITISTCGLADKIDLLGELHPQVQLAISLHNPIDNQREEIMPINKVFSIKHLFEACDRFIDKTNRQITIEYALIEGVNDQSEHAQRLSTYIKNKLYHVNLIPVNEVKETSFKKSQAKAIERFQNKLREEHIPVTVRRTLGDDINAACGQLRRSAKEVGREVTR